MSASENWPRNRLLLALPARNLKRLIPELEQIRCQRAQVLMDADSSLDHVFFPDSGVVSSLAPAIARVDGMLHLELIFSHSATADGYSARRPSMAASGAHWLLLALSVVTILGAVAGSQRWSII
jgi:hypothetical protein